MNFTEFWKAYNGVILLVATAIAAFVIWTKISISKVEGRLCIVEGKTQVYDQAIEDRNKRLGDEKLRDYRSTEAEKRLVELTTIITSGFAEIRVGINALNVQNTQIIGQLNAQQESLEKAWIKLDEHEKLLRARAEGDKI